jgi:ABC-type transport system involved in multi-copper enzyme maturation permease subunit
VIRLVAARELRAHLHSFGFWLLLAAVSGLCAWLLFAQLEVYQQISPQLLAGRSTLGINDLVIGPTLNSLALLLLLTVPLLNMHAFSDERASGRLAMLLASPLRIDQLLIGKWLGNGAAGLALMLLGLAVPASLALGASVQPGRLFSALVGLTLLVLASGAISLMFSAFARQAAAALGASYGLLLFLWLLDSLAGEAGNLRVLALNPPLGRALQGQLDSGLIGYFGLLGAAALLTTGVRLLRERASRSFLGWRGRIRSTLFVALLITNLGLALPLVQQHVLRLFDNRPPPPKALLQALDALHGPLVVTAYAPEQPLLRANIEKLLEPLRRHYPALELRYVDPLKQPQLVRDLGIRRHGELSLEAMGRREHVANPTPGNLLHAVSRLARHGEPWIVALSGHGEAALQDSGSAGLSAFAASASRLGFRLVALDMRHTAQLPDNAAALLVAAPQQAYPSALRKLIRDYLAAGGRVLWLHEQGDADTLRTIAGVRLQAPASRGLVQARAQGEAWQTEPATSDKHLALFDTASELLPDDSADWQVKGRLLPVLGSAPEKAPIGLALEHGKSRLLVVGDSDFARNDLFGRPGNSALGIAMLNWLTDNRLATAPPADDIALHWSPLLATSLAIVELVLLPVGLLLTGWTIRRRRRRA